MVADDLQLQAGARLLHIGPHKTGTTTIQGALHLARERLAKIGAEMAGNIAALGARVIGDLSALGELPETDAEPGPPLLPAEAAVQAILGAFRAGGVDGL